MDSWYVKAESTGYLGRPPALALKDCDRNPDDATRGKRVAIRREESGSGGKNWTEDRRVEGGRHRSTVMGGAPLIGAALDSVLTRAKPAQQRRCLDGAQRLGILHFTTTSLSYCPSRGVRVRWGRIKGWGRAKGN